MILRVLISAAAVAASIAPSAAAEAPLAGKWRITRAVVAPWADEAAAGEPSLAVGATVRFRARSIVGPHPIGCQNAQFAPSDVPVEGLFQGAGLTPEDAIALGLAGRNFSGVSVTCDSGVFEYHRADGESLLLALDNRIWTLDRTPGSRASASSPEGVVQRFLEAHFAGDMGFHPTAVNRKQEYLSQELKAKISDYFAKGADPDETPEVNGDPFTDSQEYPARFAVRLDDRSTPGISAPVEFSDAFTRKTVLFEMKREKGRWRINDLVYEDGKSFSALLGG